MENSMDVLEEKLKIELPYDLAIPLLSIYLKKKKKTKQTQTLIWKDTCTPISLPHDLEKTRCGNNQDVHWWMNG